MKGVSVCKQLLKTDVYTQTLSAFLWGRNIPADTALLLRPSSSSQQQQKEELGSALRGGWGRLLVTPEHEIKCSFLTETSSEMTVVLGGVSVPC